MAFLDIDLCGSVEPSCVKLVGERSARGKGYAEEATALWIKYGVADAGVSRSSFVSTLQTHLRNIKLNEAVGFRRRGRAPTAKCCSAASGTTCCAWASRCRLILPPVLELLGIQLMPPEQLVEVRAIAFRQPRRLTHVPTRDLQQLR